MEAARAELAVAGDRQHVIDEETAKEQAVFDSQKAERMNKGRGGQLPAIHKR